ncbi:MAG: AEC family transporter [Rhodoferax sp.]|nr:AEC family transporter [Rhodoferax sp.]
MHSVVLSSLLPVILLIATGFVASRIGWMRAASLKDLGSLVFMVLTPALLFRTMSTVHVERLDFKPVAAYFAAVIALFLLMLAWRRATQRATVLALAATFSNTVAIGIPLIGLAYGEAGLVTLLTIISLHALILLTLATIALELAVARQAATTAPTSQTRAHWHRPVLDALRNGILHPVPLPILLGLLFAQTGWVMPDVLDRPLQLLGSAMGPMALLLVGATLANARIGQHLRGALGLSVLKNLVLPALVATIGVLMGLHGLALTVLVVTASLPIGANVFMFSQRYQVAEELVTASVAMSTGVAVLSVSLVMTWAARL